MGPETRWKPETNGTGDPVSIPHEVENRRVATGTDQGVNMQVGGHLPPEPQVTESAGSPSQGGDTGSNPVGTTRVRGHFRGSRGQVAPHWPRGVHGGRHDGPHGSCLELGLGDRAVHSDDLVGERGLSCQVRTVDFLAV
jgi:hypothetical protein